MITIMGSVLKTVDLVKRFPAVLANDKVSITLQEGEILGLLGENGAGKSTLMNMLYGLYKPTAGEILIHDQEIHFRSPKDAIASGLGMVHQHFMLVETLTVTENIILGTEPVNKAGIVQLSTARKAVKALSEKYGLAVDPDALITDLSVGLQQRVEILKALYRKAHVLILDEPTAVLTPHETVELFTVIRSLTKHNVSIILITHKLNEVMEITDRVYIMRAGKLVYEQKTSAVSKQELADAMVGRKVLLEVDRDKRTAGSDSAQTEVLKIENVVIKNDRNLKAVDGLSLSVSAGEIVGIAGVDGNGQSELEEGLIGLLPLEKGSLHYNGLNISKTSIKERIDAQIGFVPADRHKLGLVLAMQVRENIVIGRHHSEPFSTHTVLHYEQFTELSEKLMHSFDIRPPGVENAAKNLSGGNQQKLILARIFSLNPQLLIISQPTRGLDIGAIEYIHSRIIAMREHNVAILLISLELEEIFGLSDRIIVLHKGKIVHETTPEKTDPTKIGYFMTGGNDEE